MSKHSYTEIEFKNAPDHKTTPINAANLNHMEGGISDAFTDIRAVEDALAPINLDNGTNDTGSTIKAGTFFYVNGSIAKAKTDIANGATLTENTNYKVVTAGALNELNSEINRGSVSVTANGVKTRATLLGELNALIDRTKINANSKFVFTSASGSPLALGYYYKSNNNLQFTAAACDASALAINTINFGSTASTVGAWYRNDGTSHNDSSNVDNIGTTFAIEY